MRPSGLHFFPLTLPFVLFFFLLVSTLIVVIEIGILEYAYEKMGINRRYIFTLLLLSLLGSYVNIPVAELPEEPVLSGEQIIFFGMRYVIPFVYEWPRTIVAVNVVEHIADDRALVARLAKLLKPGGKLLIYVPACPFAYGSLDRALGHYRRYTRASLTKLLADAGLHLDAPRFMNLFGLLGWTVNGRILRRERLSAVQLAIFESLMPLFSLEDRVRLPIGLGVYVAAEKPSA